jgi:lysozyme family protein
MGESRSVAFVDLEKVAVEAEEATAANEDALMVGISLGGLLLVVDFTILVCSSQPAALAAAIVFAAVVFLVTWYVRRTGPYDLTLP